MWSHNTRLEVFRILFGVFCFLALCDTLVYCDTKTFSKADIKKFIKKPANHYQDWIPEKPAINQPGRGGRSYQEVEVLVDGQFTLDYLTALPFAPQGCPESLDNPGRVILQLPDEQVQKLKNKGAQIKTLRSFILLEGGNEEIKKTIDATTPKAISSCTGQNNSTVYIPDAGSWVYSEIPISCAPAGTTVTSLDVHFEIYHTYPPDLAVDLTDSDLQSGCEIRLFEYEYSGPYISRTYNDLAFCNGRPVNQYWYLWAFDAVYGDDGYISSWWIKVYYETGGCTPPAHNDCGNAVAVSAGVTYYGNSLCSTGTDITSCGQDDTADVWHSFTPATSGLYTVSLCGSSFDTTLAVFNECWVGELACNDNSGSCGSGSTQSRIAISLDAGHQYLIRVAGVNGATGNYQLTVTRDQTQPPDGMTTCRAVICGISDYLYDSVAPDLDYCDNDAIDVRNALLLASDNWSSQNITLLTDSTATKAAIRTAIQNMASASDGDDLCLFFFSGHGLAGTDMSPYDEADGHDEFLAPHDIYYINDAISDDELGSWIAALPTNKYVILLDACYSGGQIKGVNAIKGLGGNIPRKGDGFAADLMPKIKIKDLDDNGKGVVLTACDDYETSQESSYLQNGVFTYYLVQGMDGSADSDGDGQISAEECYAWLSPRATNYNPGQHAQIYDNYTGELDFLGEQAEPEYCQVMGSCSDEYIKSVQVGSINNLNTSCGTSGYSDYTSLSTDMQTGSSYPITVKTGNYYAEDRLGIWIDWNQDKDFEDASETITVNGTPSTGDYWATIVPPAGALTGNTRMRIRVVYGAAPSPCGTYLYSETEDYTINVMAAPAQITISGYVKTSSGTGIEGVLVSANTGQSDTTDSAGFYELTAMAPWSGIVTPEKAEWAFTPDNRYYTSITANQPNQDYTGKYSYCGGSGSEIDPYLICTAEQMNRIGLDPCDWNKHFILMADIDLDPNLPGNKVFTTAIIAPDINSVASFFQGTPFTGSFDGNGKKIVNIRIDTVGNDYLGLFGQVDGSAAQIKNLGIENIVISGEYYLGGLCGQNSQGIIINCYATGQVTGGDFTEYLGGLCGNTGHGTISNSYAACQVTGGDDSLSIGGLCGASYGNVISNCYATGQVAGGNASEYLGGLCGYNWANTISNCYATGSVSGQYDIGGLCGENSYGEISNCYATGTVHGVEYVGGLCGYNDSGTISNCYATGRITGDLDTGGFCGPNSGSVSGCFWDIQTSEITTSDGGTGLTTDLMQNLSTFIDAGWDFVDETENGTEDIWRTRDGRDYPRLAWEPIPLEPPQVTGWQLITMYGSTEIWCDITDGYVEPRTSGIQYLYVCFDTGMDTSISEISEIISIEGVNGGMQTVSGWVEWWDDTCMVIYLDEALPDKDTYTITITNTAKSAAGVAIEDSSICITALKGDANGNRNVNTQDLLAIRAKLGQPVDENNAKYDINCNGTINTQDMLAARMFLANTAPACP